LDELKKYNSEEVQAMVESLASEINSGVITLDQLTDTLSQWIFRDNTSSYWTILPNESKWYRFSDGKWERSDSPPQSLEGLATLTMWTPTIREAISASNTESNGKRDPDAHAFISNTIKTIADSYEKGEITTITAHALASQNFLMDQDNRFWTTGLKTDKWYFFEAKKWLPSDEPPALDTLMDTQDPEKMEALDEVVFDFLVAMDGTPPEPITQSWDPPQNLPEPIVQCLTCTKVDVGQHTHCRFCETELPASSLPEQKTTKFCSQCGHEQPVRMKFCVQCGTKF
jgi:hypothetical protein